MTIARDTARLAVRTEKLTKHYGPVAALDDLDLELNAGEVLGYLGPNGAGKTTTIRLLLGLIKPTAGRAEIFGMDVAEHKVAVHARVAYVPGEATLWPSLTGAETLHLLARMHGETDVAYRDQLVKRFDFDTSRKVRAYSKGQPAEDQPDRGPGQPRRPAHPRRAHGRPGPPHGAGVPGERAGGEDQRADGVPVLARAVRGGGTVRPDRDPARRAGWPRSARSRRCATCRR